MRGKGINYDTGFSPGGTNSRDHFDAGIVRREMHVIAAELHCTAVRISGDQPERLSIAGEAAAAAGPEVWFAPFRCALTTDQLIPLFADCADRAGYLRRAGARVVLVAGCELTLFAVGSLPGGTVYERIDGLASGGQDLHAAFAALPGRLNGFLAATADAAPAGSPASHLRLGHVGAGSTGTRSRRTPTPGDAAKRRASVGHLAQRRSASRRVQRQSTC